MLLPQPGYPVDDRYTTGSFQTTPSLPLTHWSLKHRRSIMRPMRVCALDLAIENLLAIHTRISRISNHQQRISSTSRPFRNRRSTMRPMRVCDLNLATAILLAFHPRRRRIWRRISNHQRRTSSTSTPWSVMHRISVMRPMRVRGHHLVPPFF